MLCLSLHQDQVIASILCIFFLSVCCPHVREMFDYIRSWVAGNEMIINNVNAKIPVSSSWLLLPFLAFLCFPASSQPIDSSLYWPNSVSVQKRGCPRLRFCDSVENRKRGQPHFCTETQLGQYKLESMG